MSEIEAPFDRLDDELADTEAALAERDEKLAEGLEEFTDPPAATPSGKPNRQAIEARIDALLLKAEAPHRKAINDQVAALRAQLEEA